MIAAVAAGLSIWGAVTGFYGTKQWEPVKICQATYMGDRLRDGRGADPRSRATSPRCIC